MPKPSSRQRHFIPITRPLLTFAKGLSNQGGSGMDKT